MSLYSDWQELANVERTQQESDAFWQTYFDQETENYKKILGNYTEPYSGKFTELADTFGMEPLFFMGFLDGINTSLKKEYKLDGVKIGSKIDLDIDFEKLYFNMLDCKANWLYSLPEWAPILTEARRKEITKEYRSSKMYINTETVGRNDPCPCGSGKKYKKCCGKDK